MLTYSRTAIVGFIIYNIIKYIDFKRLIRFQITKRSILILIFLILLGLYMLNVLLIGVGPGGSAYMKFEAFSRHFERSNLLTLLFGGTHNVQFDAELGYWIGAVGFVGLFGLALFLRKIVVINNSALPFIIALIFISIGNTLFYGLLTANVALIYLLIISSDYIENLKDKKLNE